MPGEIKIPGPDHPITITPTGQTVVVRVGDRVIAESANAVTLQEANYPAVQYLPLADVDPAVLVRTATQTYCPYKGDASYYTIALSDGDLVDAIWTYEQPYSSVSDIENRVAFYPDKVEINVG
jgi:uncharacterized protein (DUF427 family)